MLDSENLLGTPALDRSVPYMDLKPRKGHFPGPAKAVIQLVQNGGPSQMDLFDPKPELTRRAGQPHPDGVEIHQPNNLNILMPCPYEFKKHGQSGMEIAEVLPHLSGVADELCMVRSMYSVHNNHPEGLNNLLTSQIFPGRPVMGSWISYALGTENQNLPAYVVLRAPEGYSVSGKILWSSGWLPALYQGVEFSSIGTPVHHLQQDVPLPPGCSGRASTCWPVSTGGISSIIRKRRSWKPGSRTTNWRRGCSWRRPTCWISPRSRRPPGRCTAWTIP